MKASEDTFRTFCHISEYGEEGYEDLHRMIAASDPLVLWSPSSVLLRSARCRVEPREFVRYVEEGHVRVVGRAEWLLDRSYRDSHPWVGARWDEAVDGALHSLCHNDESERDGPRVAVAPPEEGWAAAEELVSEHPEYVSRLSRVFNSRQAKDQIPEGTLETARRRADEPRGVAVAILRDAYNHGHAIDFVQPEAPFLLSSRESQFLRLLAGFRGPTPAKPVVRASTAGRQEVQNVAELGRQLREVMRFMDTARNPDRLGPFMRGEGHRLLVGWFARICADVRSERPADLDRKVIEALHRDLEEGRFRTSWREIFGRPTTMATMVGGLATDAVGVALDPSGALSLAGLGFDVIAVVEGLLQRLGWIRPDYTGPQWPFLYAYGRKASLRRHRSMLRILDQVPR